MDTILQNPDRLDQTNLSSKPSLFQAATITDIPLVAKLEAMSTSNQILNPNYDPTFSITSNEAEDLFKAYGIDNMPDRASKFDAQNINQLKLQLETYNTYKKADTQLGEAGFVPATLAHLGAGALDLGGMYLSGGVFNMSMKAMSAFSALESTALASLANGVSGAVAGGIVGSGVEYATEKLAYSYDKERVQDVGLGSMILAGLGGSITTALTHSKTPSSATTVINGLNAAGGQHNDIEFTSALGKLGFGVHERLMNNHQAYKEEALNITNSAVAIRDANTKERIVQNTPTAKDIKEEGLGAGATYLSDSEKVHKTKYSNMSVDEFVNKQGSEATIYTNKANQEAGRLYINEMKTLDDKLKLYIAETGDLKVTKDNIPDDLEQVLIGHYHKRLVDTFPKAPDIVEPLTKMYKFFGEKGTNVKLHGLGGKVSDFYHNRLWSEKAFRELPENVLVDKLVKGMEEDTITKHLLSIGELKREDLVSKASGMVDDIKRTSLMKEYTEPGFISKSGGANPLKSRTININTDYVMDLLVHDAATIADRYSDKLSGRLALKHLGVDVGAGQRSLSEALESRISEIGNKALKGGATRDQIISGADNLRVAYEDLLGVRKIVNKPDALGHKITSHLRLAASSAFSGGFVKAAINELGAIVTRSSLLALKQFVPAHDLVLKKLRNGDTKLADELLSVHVGAQILDGARTSRYEMDELKLTHSWVERKLISLNRAQRQLTGFNAVTSISDNMAALALFDELKRFSKSGNMSEGTKDRFSRLGLSTEDIKEFKRKAEVSYAPNSGKLISINWDTWADQSYASAIKFAVNRHVRETVLRGDTLHLPKSASDVNSDIISLFWQFKHYPLEATNRFLLSGMNENIANTVTGSIVSMGIAASMTKLTNEALYQLGVVDKRIEDTELFKQAFDKSSISGVIPNIVSLGQGLTGTETYREKDITKSAFGASGSVVTIANKIRDKVAHGEPLTTKDYDTMYSIIPLSHIPLLNELSRSLIKHNF